MAKGKYEYWLTEDGLLLLSAWARDGLSEEQIAHNMNVAYSTLRTWKDKYPALSAALKKGKEVVDIEVENALYKNAVGFKETVKKPIKVKRVDYENGKRLKEYEEVVEAEEEIFVPPNTVAQIFWLKNRKPAEWKDKREEIEQEQEEKETVRIELTRNGKQYEQNSDNP
ncbi:MAG: transposase [Lachnospiraceae bacterium]|nr:transposase [Lachnospiraceae bacterium]